MPLFFFLVLGFWTDGVLGGRGDVKTKNENIIFAIIRNKNKTDSMISVLSGVVVVWSLW